MKFESDASVLRLKASHSHTHTHTHMPPTLQLIIPSSPPLSWSQTVTHTHQLLQHQRFFVSLRVNFWFCSALGSIARCPFCWRVSRWMSRVINIYTSPLNYECCHRAEEVFWIETKVAQLKPYKKHRGGGGRAMRSAVCNVDRPLTLTICGKYDTYWGILDNTAFTTI